MLKRNNIACLASVSDMKRKHEDDGDGGSSTKTQNVMGQSHSNTAVKTTEENATSSLPTANVMIAEQITDKSTSLHEGMFLRLTYWLNNTLTKAINAGLYRFSPTKSYEPCVIFTNTNKKIFPITHREWDSMSSYINEVTVCMEKKEKKTIFVPQEDAIAHAYTIRPLFGKMYVTLFTFDNDKLTSPFVLKEDEWNMVVKCMPTVQSHLRKLVHNASVINEYVQSEQTTPESASDIQAYDRLVGEIHAFY